MSGTSSGPAVTLTEVVTPELREAVLSGLRAYNVAQTGGPAPSPLAITVRGRDGDPKGGLIGRTGFGWLTIELFFLPETLRRNGLGLSIIRQAEAEALRRGCHSARVETASFQARGFYEKAGYQVFATLERFPDDHESYYLRKALVV